MKRWAVDTNVVVRLLTKDDPEQLERVLQVLSEGVLVVQPTVLLETEWVLRAVCGYTRSQLSTAFKDLVALSNIVIVDEERVMSAIDLHANGADFADALHLFGASGCEAFLTFDTGLAKRSNRLGSIVPVRLL